MKKKSEKIKMKKERLPKCASFVNYILPSCLFSLFILLSSFVFAQDFGFGFGSMDTDTDFGFGTGGGSPPAVSIGGEVQASLMGIFDEFSEGADHTRLGEVFSGKLNFTADTSIATGVINLKIGTDLIYYDQQSPIFVDEAFVRAFFGDLEVVGGLRKLAWGKADSFGPLDVINPKDYSELTDFSDSMNLKIARPLIQASYRIGSFTKIEGVFVPTFEPLRYATKGRWVPAEMEQLYELEALGATINEPDTTTLSYAQAGLRFTTTIGPADFGMQYYYGRLTKPAVTFAFDPLLSPIPTAVNFDYNPYHQIGIDWAAVLLGFNVRAELAANITEDLSGEDGSVYNPAVLWSFGFDRDLFWGINLNLQCNESIILMHSKIGDNHILDIEAGAGMTYTQIIAALSKKFLRDALEFRFAALWGIEDNDFVLLPSLTWTKDTVSVDLSVGIFGGDEGGQFGQYHKNNFMRVTMKYAF